MLFLENIKGKMDPGGSGRRGNANGGGMGTEEKRSHSFILKMAPGTGSFMCVSTSLQG